MVFGWHFLTSRFSFSALDPTACCSSVGPACSRSACWVIGIWGSAASLAEAALPRPRTAEFPPRVRGNDASPQPAVIAVHHRGDRFHDRGQAASRSARTEDQVSIWWLAKLSRDHHAPAGRSRTTGSRNAQPGRWRCSGSALRDDPPVLHDRAPSKWISWGGADLMPWAAARLGQPDLPTRRCVIFTRCRRSRPGVLRGVRRRHLPRTIAGSLVAILVVASIGWIVVDGLQRRWVSARTNGPTERGRRWPRTRGRERRRLGRSSC